MNKYLTGETARWVAEGIIDETQRAAILNLYHKERSYNPILIIFAILGSLLLGLGVILVFASNWDIIPKPGKIFIAFLPLLSAISFKLFSFLRRPLSAAFNESSSLLLCLSVFATIALIGQVFHTSSSLISYLGLCLFMSLPALYLFGSKSPAALLVFCTIFIGILGETGGLLSVICALSILPYLILQIIKCGSKQILWYATVLANLLLILMIFKIPGVFTDIIIKFITCSITVLAFEAFVTRIKNFENTVPFTPLACLTIIGVLMLSCFRGAYLNALWADMNILVIFAFIAALFLYAAVRFIKQGFSLTAVDLTVLCALLGLPLFWLWSNFLLFALGIWLVFSGAKTYSLKYVNYGMLLLIFIIAARFFDSDLGLLSRGLAFIALGLGFIITNLIIHKKWSAR